jgi:putative ABC transport system permease protein
VKLGLREMRRAKVRFGLLVGAIGLLVFLIFFQQTLLTNLLGFFTGALENQSAEVVVYDRDARRNLAGSVVTPEQVDAVRRVPGVERAEPLGEGTFTTRTADSELVDGILFGYVLGGPGEPTTLSSGRLPRGPGEGVASAIDADNGFDVGDSVEILSGDGGENLRIRVVGLADDTRFSVQPVVFVSYPTFETARRVANPDASRAPVFPSAVAVSPADGVSAAALAERIDRDVQGVEALDRATAVDSLPGVAAVSQSFGIILFLAFLVVTLVTGFFFVILTVQKAAALTLLRAVGASAGELVAALLLQVVLVVVGGLAVGIGLLALASLLSSPTFPFQIDPGSVARSAVIVFGLALLASIVAVRRVTRIDPAAAVTSSGLGGLT